MTHTHFLPSREKHQKERKRDVAFVQNVVEKISTKVFRRWWWWWLSSLDATMRCKIALLCVVFVLSSPFAIVKEVRCEGELKLRDDGQLIASEHFPVHGIVPLENLVPPLESASEIKITLTVSGGSGSQKVRTRPKKDGTFALLDVPPGDHTLQIVAIGFSFPPIIVSVDGENNGEVVMRYSEDMSTILPKLKTPEGTTKEKTIERVVVAPVSKVDYFEPSNRVTLLGLLKNPMVLMVLMTVIMAVAVPSLVRNMDPEALEELKKEMGKGNVFQQMAAANKAMDASVEKQVNSKFGVKEEKVGGGKIDEKK